MAKFGSALEVMMGYDGKNGDASYSSVRVVNRKIPSKTAIFTVISSFKAEGYVLLTP